MASLTKRGTGTGPGANKRFVSECSVFVSNVRIFQMNRKLPRFIKMKILITGGTGFIGQHLVPALLEQGHQVSILTRSNRQDPQKKIDYLQWNGTSMPIGIGLFDVVINLAGASIGRFRWSKSIKKDILDSRVEATRACVEYLNNSPSPPLLFISASGVGYYGTKKEDEIHERARPGDDFPAKVTIEWEEEAKKSSVRTIIPRFGVVLGDGGALEPIAKVYRWYLGGKLGPGTQGFPWVHIQDVVGAILLFLEAEELEGPVNVVAPQIIDQKRFSDALASEMRVKAPWTVPKFFLKILMGEASVLLWGGQKVIPRVLQREKFVYKYPDIDKALKQIFNG